MQFYDNAVPFIKVYYIINVFFLGSRHPSVPNRIRPATKNDATHPCSHSWHVRTVCTSYASPSDAAFFLPLWARRPTRPSTSGTSEQLFCGGECTLPNCQKDDRWLVDDAANRLTAAEYLATSIDDPEPNVCRSNCVTWPAMVALCWRAPTAYRCFAVERNQLNWRPFLRRRTVTELRWTKTTGCCSSGLWLPDNFSSTQLCAARTIWDWLIDLLLHQNR